MKALTLEKPFVFLEANLSTVLAKKRLTHYGVVLHICKLVLEIWPSSLTAMATIIIILMNVRSPCCLYVAQRV